MLESLSIAYRRTVATGQVSCIQVGGTALFSVDPTEPANARIADIELAPRDDRGRVVFSADWSLLFPEKHSGDLTLLVDVPNRGRPIIMKYLNYGAESTIANLDGGDGFIAERGMAVLWVGWQGDLIDAAVLRADLPRISLDDVPGCDHLSFSFAPDRAGTERYLADSGHVAYPRREGSSSGADAVLTVKDGEDAPELPISDSEWRFGRVVDGLEVEDPTYITMPAGFQPGATYRLVYRTPESRVVGCGLLALRDLVSFLRGDPDNPLPTPVSTALAFGASQGARFLRGFLADGCNADEAGERVFDGMFLHVAGAKNGEFNQRCGRPSTQSSRSRIAAPPMADLPTMDPVLGVTRGLLDLTTGPGGRTTPKVFHTVSSSEYWGGHGAFLHVDPTGVQDLELPASSRLYLLVGQHHYGLPELVYRSAATVDAEHAHNWTDNRPVLRALLSRLETWVKDGFEPPDSRHPRLSDRTLDEVGAVANQLGGLGFPPPSPLAAWARYGFECPDHDSETGVARDLGIPYPHLVPTVDADGNEIAGVKLPYLSLPIATSAGWNSTRVEGQARRLLASGETDGGTVIGSVIPFPAGERGSVDSAPNRHAPGKDPRQPIPTRYRSAEDYRARLEDVALEMVDSGLLLSTDVYRVLEDAMTRYQLVMGDSDRSKAAE